MQCKKAHQLFGSYLDGELTFEEEEMVDAHMVGCPQCRTEFRGLRRTRDLLLSLPQEDPGEAFTSAVMSRVREARAEELAPVRPPLGERLAAWFGTWLAPKPALGVAAALALGLVAGLGLTQIAGTEGDPAQAPLQAEQVSPPAQEGVTTTALEALAFDRVATPVRGREGGTIYMVQQRPGEQRVEFVLEPFILRDGTQQVAEPLFPQASPRLTEGSPDGASITF